MIKHSRKSVWASERVGFTLAELTAALLILAVVAVIVTQCAVWAQRERTRLAAQHAALELAANVLEAAKAQPWEKLDKAWADGRSIPGDMADLLPSGNLEVVVAEGPARLSRRVTAEVSWQIEAHLPPQSVKLTSVFAARSKGGTP